MTRAQAYSICMQYSEEDKAYVVWVPELPGCMADGQTQSGALVAIWNAIELWIETAKRLGRPIPEPRPIGPVKRGPKQPA